VLSLKLISQAGYVDALIQVAQLEAIYKPEAVYKAANEYAGQLRAITEESNEADHLLSASRLAAEVSKELGTAIDVP
jgi:hypothetical protein